MTSTSDSRAQDQEPGARSPETALSWAALAAAAGAVVAWAACCVLPMSLAIAGLGLGGFSWIAGQRTWITIAALTVIAAGWLLTWRRVRTCRSDVACAQPLRLRITLLVTATLLGIVALIWQPLIEPWALAMIRSARG